jgi:hypothetical protein
MGPKFTPVARVRQSRSSEIWQKGHAQNSPGLRIIREGHRGESFFGCRLQVTIGEQVKGNRLADF